MVQEKYYPGFDYLRAFFCIAIVGWHTKVFGYAHILDKSLDTFRVTLPDIIYANILLLGVPLFHQVSLFLYIQNRKRNDYFIGRIKKLGFLYLFWTLVSVVFLYDGMDFNKVISLDYWIAAGYTHIYFIFSLIVTTIVTELLCLLSSRVSENKFRVLTVLLLLASCMVLIFRIPLYELLKTSHYAYLIVAFYSPINFIPYVFTAMLIAHYWKKSSSSLLGMLFLLSSLFVVWEWKSQVNVFNLGQGGLLISPYARLSLVMTASLVMCLVLKITQRAPNLILQISNLSLGVYITHYYFANKLFQFSPDLARIAVDNGMLLFVFVLVLSLGLSYVIKYKKIT
ncbi:acyltransferase [Pelosinus sp. IPA-1]|uniref:acyltransferase n=1 Tax=Pelosinus sp. IPA-1 TaxID=3029569 RepID=UPI002556D1D5|nr:acyltransferase [Pelosinus sp. IPA-1]